MNEDDPNVVVRVGGEAGEGTITLGDLFTRIAAHAGLEVYTYRTYPSSIKGGQVLYQTRLGSERVLSEGDDADLLVAMNALAWAESRHDLKRDGLLLYDPDALDAPSIAAERAWPLPATQLARKLDWPRGKNIVMVGALTWLFGLPLKEAKAILRQRLGHYPDVLPHNLEAMEAGYAYAREHYPDRLPCRLPLPDAPEERLLLSGADALALGALAAGCRFYAGYPITPATPVMEALAKYLPAFGGSFVQAEDEIAAINMVVGASFAGRPAMTATSGPGLSLMIETLGMASMAEVPVVVVDVQRGGPSTGLPTKTSQGDLFLALYGGHGDAPRFVLAPDSVKDSYYEMINAFSLAEHYQMPVIVLSDQAMAARLETIPYPDREGLEWCEHLTRRIPDAKSLEKDYRRYRQTEDGISPMALPGMPGGMYTAESLEHDEYGHPTQAPRVHAAMMAKRARKVETARQRLVGWKAAARRWGTRGAPFGVMGWGSTRGAVREAMHIIGKERIPLEALYPHTLLPMPDRAIGDFLHGKKSILIPELNFSSQFARMIEHRYYRQLEEEGIHVYMLPKEEGRPFKVREIVQAIIEMVEAEGGAL